MTTEKYDAQAAGWTDAAYADPERYLRHRADLVVAVGPSLEPGDEVLDLACGDAGLAAPLLAHGMRYTGVDLSAPMVAAARERLGDRITVVGADLNDYAPPAAVACTTCFRALYYARDRAAFFRHVAAFTEKKLVFDLNPRQFPLEGILAELQAAGLGAVSLHPFFSPQRVGLPGPVAAGFEALERTGPLARALLRVRFTYLVGASPR